METKKKILSMILSASMLFSMSFNVFAESKSTIKPTGNSMPIIYTFDTADAYTIDGSSAKPENGVLKLTHTNRSDTTEFYLGTVAVNSIANISFDIKTNSQFKMSTSYSLEKPDGTSTAVIETLYCINTSRGLVLRDSTGSGLRSNGNTDKILDCYNENGANIRLQYDFVSNKLRLFINDTEISYLSESTGEALGIPTLPEYAKRVTGITFHTFTDSMVIDNFKVSYEKDDIVAAIDSIDGVSNDNIALIKSLSERVNAYKAAYADNYNNDITNESKLNDLIAAAEEYENIKGNVNLTASRYYTSVVNMPQIFNFNDKYTLTGVKVNGVEIDSYAVKNNRIKINKENFANAGDYNLTFTFQKDSLSCDINYSAKVIANEAFVINAIENTDYSMVPSELKNESADTYGYWNAYTKNWSAWSSVGAEPIYLRIDLSDYNNESYSYSFSNLPIGKFKVEYANYAGIGANRIPMVDVKGGTLSATIDPYNAEKGYTEIGNAVFTKADNSICVSISDKAAQTNNSKTANNAIAAVYAIRLTPICEDIEAIDKYFENGSTNTVDIINAAETAGELRTLTEQFKSEIGVDTDALDVMDGVYETLIGELKLTPFASLEDYALAFSAAVKKQLTAVEVTSFVNSIEDLTRTDHAAFYVRPANTGYELYTSSGINRPAYNYYSDIDTKYLSMIEVKFTATKATDYKISTSLDSMPDTNRLTGKITDETVSNSIKQYVDNFNALETITVTADDVTKNYTADFYNVSSITDGISFKYEAGSTSAAGINKPTITAYYDYTGAYAAVTAINQAASAKEIRTVTEANAKYFDVNVEILADMESVYTVLENNAREYNSVEDYREAFYAAIKTLLSGREIEIVRSVEDLRLTNAGAPLYLRTVSTYSLTGRMYDAATGTTVPDSSVDRPAYEYYSLSTDNLKLLELSITGASAGEVEVAVSTEKLPVTAEYASGLKKTDNETDYNSLTSFIDGFNSIYKKSITIGKDETAIIDIEDILGQITGDITIRYMAKVSGTSIQKPVLKAYYDEINVPKVETFTISQVSFQDEPAESGNEWKSYIGRAFVTKNTTKEINDAVLYVAAYEKSGILIQVDKIKFDSNLMEHNVTNENVSLNIKYNVVPDTVKLFIWQDSSISPYAYSFVINNTNSTVPGWYFADGSYMTNDDWKAAQ